MGPINANAGNKKGGRPPKIKKWGNPLWIVSQRLHHAEELGVAEAVTWRALHDTLDIGTLHERHKRLYTV